MPQTIGNPLSWTASAVRSSARGASSLVGSLSVDPTQENAPPVVRAITLQNVKRALALGWDDLSTFRSDVMFTCLLYPIIGIVLVALTLQGNNAHLIFPFLSGFALAGPVAAVGLYEMSRRREAGLPVTWMAYFDVLRSAKFGAVLVLGLFHAVVFAAWIMTSNTIYDMTMGSVPPTSITALLSEVVTTPAGWTLIVVGVAVGFLFAALVLAMSVVSFPLLLDRNVSLAEAVVTSIRVALRNPVPIGVWGLIVAGSLALGTVPALLGLVLVLPLLGHATWHLYRAAVG